VETENLDFADIYEAYQARILRYLTRVVGEHDAEDLAQEVFIKVSRALPSFRGESQLSTWIYRIATHAAIDRLRTASYRKETENPELEDLDEVEADAWTGEEIPSLEQQLMRKEMYDCFEKFVSRLPVNYRTIYVLGDLEGLSNAEICEILGLTLEVVKIRLHRGRGMLLNQLKKHCKAEDWL